MAKGKSIENRYNAPTKTYETITEHGHGGIFTTSNALTFRRSERAERKASQLEERRAAKARARANGKRDGR